MRPTINALIGLRDTYEPDGRVITQALVPGAVPAGARGGPEHRSRRSATAYKAINAPFGQFAQDMLVTSTKALKGADPGDATYTSKEASIASLTARATRWRSRSARRSTWRSSPSQPIDPVQAASWIEPGADAADQRRRAGRRAVKGRAAPGAASGRSHRLGSAA